MEDKLTLERIKLMHPKVRSEVEHTYRAIIVPALSGRAICRIESTLRTFEEQTEIYAQGRTKFYDSNGRRLGIVTNAPAGQSIHNYGLAFDIALLVDSDRNGSFESLSYNQVIDYDGDRIADWMEVVKIMKSLGWNWGGDWKDFKDAPHFEKTFGYTWKQLKKKYDKKDFIPGTKYVNI